MIFSIGKFKEISLNFFHLLGPVGFRWFLISLASSFGIAIIELSLSAVIQLLLISFGILPQPQTIFYTKFIPHISILFVISILLPIAIIRFFIQLTCTQTISYLKDLVVHKLRQSCIYDVFFANESSARLSSSINFKLGEIIGKASEFTFNFSMLYSMIAQSALLIITMFFLAWKESLLSLLGILIISNIILSINKKVSKIARTIPEKQNLLNRKIEKIVRNFILIKLLKKRDQEYSKIEKLVTEYSAKSTQASFLSNAAAQLGPVLGISLLVIVIFCSQTFWHTKPLTLISFIYLLARFVQSLSILSGYFGNAMITLPQFRIAIDIINVRDENPVKFSVVGSIDEKNSHLKTNKEPSSSHKNIHSPSLSLCHVEFNYSTSSNLIRDLSFNVEAGQQVGLIGESGSGKSTILMLILGILKPNAGKVFIDGFSPEKYMEVQEHRISYVGTEPYLFAGSIRENLTYGTPPKTDQELEKILEDVSLGNLLIEKGLDYSITEDLSSLSAGQKQRLCLARALLNEPVLLILDESSANLDEQNERIMADVLSHYKGRCTTLIVSHRQGILHYADKIINIDRERKSTQQKETI